MKFPIPATLATTLALIGQVAGAPLDHQDLEKKDASSATAVKPEPVAPIGQPVALEKKAAEPETAESNGQFVEIRDVPDSTKTEKLMPRATTTASASASVSNVVAPTGGTDCVVM